MSKLLSQGDLRLRNKLYSRSNLFRWMRSLGFPTPTSIGRSNFWIESEVEAWEARQAAESRRRWAERIAREKARDAAAAQDDPLRPLN